MRRRVVGVAALLALVVASVAGQAVAGSSSSRPAVRAVPGKGLTIRGTGFAPRERVAVTLYAVNVRRGAVTIASATGTFTVRLAYTPPRCSVWRVKATGPRSGTVWFRSPLVECAPTDLQTRSATP